MPPQRDCYVVGDNETSYEPFHSDGRDSVESESIYSDALKYDQHTALLRSLRMCRLYLTILVLVFIFIIPYTAYMYIRLSTRSPSVRHGLGTDPSHFVPPEVGEPLQWKLFGENDPYFVDLDTFQTLSKTKAAAAKLKSLHGSYHVLVGGNQTSYVDGHGAMRPLPPIVTSSGTDMYIIRGFHQMHCVTVLIEAYGYAVHAHAPKWSPEYVAHCINMVRESVSCLADAAPVSYLHKKGVGLVGAGQKMRCRDYGALLSWAKDPVRRVEFQNVADEDEGNAFVEAIRER
ncbi:DUF3328 domain containing protein [Pyrenophora tritici-repentis]|nr:DUF3328 domain containing protein [Pyrenophora tritici-repentis]KAI2483721.1 DUF3328 domain containing protein [Pyrenophora tritici-repentis]